MTLPQGSFIWRNTDRYGLVNMVYVESEVILFIGFLVVCRQWVRISKNNNSNNKAYNVSGSDSKASVYNARDPALIRGSGRPAGEGNGNPLQYYCLQNPMDREAS